MFNWIKEHKIVLIIILLVISIIWLGLTVKSNILSKSRAVSGRMVAKPGKTAVVLQDAPDMQEAFIRVAEAVGPAVVSIVTETTQKIPAQQFYFGPPRGRFGGEEAEKFFRDFFGGQIPEREFKRQGLGSGIIIDKKGYIITNDHVIAGANKITAILPDGRRFDAEIKGVDPRSDLAVIKVEADNLPVAKFGDSDFVKTGQWVVAIGNPFGFIVNNPKPTVTVGVISALHRSLPLGSINGRNYIDLIQTDAAINPGNSGGPLCDLNGNIIGLNVAIFSTSGGYQGIGFAIPANTIKWAVGDLIKGKKVLYGWIGATIQEMSHDMAEYFNIEDRKGAIVIEKIENGPADKGGIKIGDIITTFNGKAIDSVQTLLKYVNTAEVNKEAKIGLVRDGEDMTLIVVIGERPLEEIVAGKEEKDITKMAKTKKWRGMTVVEITGQIVKRYGIEKEAGVLVVEVKMGTPAYDAGLRSGLVIKAVNKNTIHNIEDYDNTTQSVKGNVLIRTNKGYAVVKTEKAVE